MQYFTVFFLHVLVNSRKCYNIHVCSAKEFIIFLGHLFKISVIVVMLLLLCFFLLFLLFVCFFGFLILKTEVNILFIRRKLYSFYTIKYKKNAYLTILA